MTKSTAESVDEYLKEVPEERREALSDLRARIKRRAPNAEESIQYGMPTCSSGGPLFSLASQRQHMALYVDPELLDAYRRRIPDRPARFLVLDGWLGVVYIGGSPVLQECECSGQVKRLMSELQAEGSAHVVGRGRGARWMWPGQ